MLIPFVIIALLIKLDFCFNVIMIKLYKVNFAIYLCKMFYNICNVNILFNMFIKYTRA